MSCDRDMLVGPCDLLRPPGGRHESYDRSCPIVGIYYGSVCGQVEGVWGEGQIAIVYANPVR